jgi:hypothetical protein
MNDEPFETPPSPRELQAELDAWERLSDEAWAMIEQ